MDLLMSAINFILIISILVIAHELGHYLAAKQCGMMAEEFSVGMGPIAAKLFRRGETLFTLRWLPIGGFVRITGMMPEEEHVEGGFNTKPLRQRMWVVFAGPLASLLFGYVAITGLGMFAGVPDFEKPIPVVDDVMPKSAAARAGLQTGDRIVQIDDAPIAQWAEIRQHIRESEGKELRLTVLRGGVRIVLSAKPEIDPLAKEFKLGFLPSLEMRRLGPIAAVVNGTMVTGRFVGQIAGIFTHPRAMKDQVGGPIAIGRLTHSATQKGLYWIVFFAATLSISLGILNLLPIPVLDGGHLMLFTLEWLRGGRKLSPSSQMVVQYVGLAAIALIFVSVMYLDIGRLVGK